MKWFYLVGWGITFITEYEDIGIFFAVIVGLA
jgi:hypothetical protein